MRLCVFHLRVGSANQVFLGHPLQSRMIFELNMNYLRTKNQLGTWPKNIFLSPIIFRQNAVKPIYCISIPPDGIWIPKIYWSTCSDHYYISVHGSCLTYFINPQQYLPTTQKKEIKESITMMLGLVRISNRVFWVSGYGILYAKGAGWEGGGV